MLYKEIVDVYLKLEKTSKRLDKTYYIAQILKKAKGDELDTIITLIRGKIFAEWDDKKIGVAAKLMLKAINVSFGVDLNKIEQEWKKTGDLGKAAENLAKNKKQVTLFSEKLTAKKVLGNIKQLADISGSGSVDIKVKLIAQLLTSASPAEARFIVRIVLEDMRVGVGEGSLRDAIAWAFLPSPILQKCECNELVPENKICLVCGKELPKIKKDEKDKAREEYNKTIEAVQHALNVSADISKVAEIAKTKGLPGLKKVSLSPTNPIKVMLYQKSKGMEDAFERVGKPAAVEFKYDGFRMQIHKDKDEIKLFTRRLEDVTHQFPDVVKLARENITGKDYIVDCEVIGFDKKTGKWLPFQSISQRIRRKYDIEKLVKKVPIIINIFDIVEFDGKNMLEVEFKDRRAMIKKIVREKKNAIQLAEQIVTDDIEEAQKFYEKALELGNEGVMVKNLSAPYKPGSRVGYGVKVKPTMETLDLVVVGATWGEGKRSDWLSSFIIACRGEDGELLEIGRVGTGFKEKSEQDGLSFEELTNSLKEHITDEKGKEVRVKPTIVIEVAFEEIQKSPTYSSGYALRFPRVIRLRDDKPTDEASSIDLVEDLYYGQKKR